MTAAGAVEVVLGFDAGTTSAKAVALDRAGAVRAAGESDPILTRSPEPGASEQEPEEIWRAVAAAGRRAMGGLPPGARVAALAVAAQSGSVVPVRASGRAGPAVTWMDARSQDLVESWPPRAAERIRELSGWTPATGYGLSTIARLAGRSGSARSETTRPGPDGPPDTEAGPNSSTRSEASSDGSPGSALGPDPTGPVPTGQDPVARWASVDDYLMHRLTGRWATNPSNASGMGLMDVSARAWSGELCRMAGADPSMLSEIVESGSAAGELSPEAAAALGVPAGTPVAAGGHDQACAALGLGAVEPGQMFLSAGTAWVLTAVTDRACVRAFHPGLNLSPHVVAGRWTVSESLGGLGAEIAEAAPDQARAVFEHCARRVGEALARAAGETDATLSEAAGETDATLSEAAGETDATLSGAAGAAAADAASGTMGRAHPATVKRGATYAAAADVAGGSGELILVGGGSGLPELLEILARVTGRRVVARPDQSWPAQGAARLAAAAAGWTLPPSQGEQIQSPPQGEPTRREAP